MDRFVEKRILKKERRRKWVKAGTAAIVAVASVFLGASRLRPQVSLEDVYLSSVDRGEISVSVPAAGKVAPAFEEIINSPISSRILEVCRKSGDILQAGDPILKLDLTSTEISYRKMLDQERMKLLDLQRLRISNESRLSEMKMNLKVQRMELSRKEAQMRNERYLDSLGSGTTEKVKQAELNVNVGVLQLQEQEQKYENQRILMEADEKVKELELNIFREELAEMRRTLEQARILSPRKGVLTYVNDEIGMQIERGTKVAVVSDLSHFKIDGTIADSYGDRIAVGNKVLVKIGPDRLAGAVVSLTPLSRNGVFSFAVRLEEDSHPRLRSGLKADVYVMDAIKDNVLRIARGGYYAGPGEYDMFVRRENYLVKCKVKLGECSFDFVEVTAGLNPGDQVLTEGAEQLKGRSKVRLIF